MRVISLQPHAFGFAIHECQKWHVSVRPETSVAFFPQHHFRKTYNFDLNYLSTHVIAVIAVPC